MIITLLILVVLLAISAAFSSFETALFSFTSFQRSKMKEAGSLSATILKVIDSPREFLTTVLFGNEVVNIAISIIAGAAAYKIFTDVPIHTLSLVSTGVTTLVILIFGEIMPKNIAVRNPSIVSQVLIIPYLIFSWAIFPFRILFSKISDSIVGLFGADPRKNRRLIVEEELRSILDLGKKEGTLADLERNLIQNALDFSTLKTFDVMTPRKKIVALPIDSSWQQILQVLKESRFSRIPIYEGELDQVRGVFHAKELLSCRVPGGNMESFSLSSSLKPFLNVEADETLDHVFQEFQRRRVHMGIVRDPAGKMIGLITMEDVLRRFFR